MKKLVCLLISLFLITGCFAGCGQSNTSQTQSDETQAVKAAQKPTQAVEETDEPETDPPTEEPTEDLEKMKKEYKESCEEIDYNSLARNPDKVYGKAVKITGKVVQVMEYDGSGLVDLRVNITKSEYGFYDDTVYVSGTLDKSGDRILEDDIITIWGNCGGTHTYETVLGAKVTVPLIYMMYYEIHGVESDDSGDSGTKSDKKSSGTKKGIENDTSSDDFYAYGDGDYVASGLKVTRYAVLHIEYTGTGHFSVTSYIGDDYQDLLANEVGNYTGDVLVDESGDYTLQIKARDGNWNITSSGLTIDDTTSFSGHGDSVTGLTSASGGTWEITNKNTDSHFSVTQYGYESGYMKLLANEIGEYSGTVKAESGDNIFFKVKSEGDWTIKKKD